MIKSSISTQEVVDFLNNALELDSASIGNLFSIRVPCNQELADHPTIQVGCQGTYCQVGLVGILNGMFGTYENGWGCLSLDVDDGKVIGFRVLDESVARNKD